MGGLLVKEILLHAADGRTDFATFAEAACGVVFLATPHTGAGLAKAVKALGVLYRGTPAVEDLRRNDAHLRQINDRYRDWAIDTSIRHLVFVETHSIKGMLVVDESSANPGLARVRPIPVDANHIDICKPSSRSSLVYGQIKRLLSNLTRPPVPGPDGNARRVGIDPDDGRRMGDMTNRPTVEKVSAQDKRENNQGFSTSDSQCENIPLRILFAIDASESMTVAKMGVFNHAMREMLPTLGQVADENPHAAIEIEVLTFGVRVGWVTRAPIPLERFRWSDISADTIAERPRLPRLNPALHVLAAAIGEDDLPRVAFPPALVLILASSPADDIDSGMRAIMTAPWGRQSVRLGIPIGVDSDLTVLRRFAGDEMVISAANAADFTAYLKWIPVERDDPRLDDVW
jgi:uncharacterized protein YegL